MQDILFIKSCTKNTTEIIWLHEDDNFLHLVQKQNDKKLVVNKRCFFLQLKYKNVELKFENSL
jgi:hypothetical protein